MRSRLAVSVLFILIASTFASDAMAAFGKFRSWTGKVYGGCATQVCSRLRPAKFAGAQARENNRVSGIKGGEKDGVTMIHLEGDRLLRQNCGTANQPCVMGTISPDGKTITFNLPEATGLVSSQEEHTRSVVYKLVSSENNGEAFEFITTAGRQIQQVLSLIRLK